MTLTKEQLDLRRTGISSSDIPAILGMDPFGKGPFQVWLEKVHPQEVAPREGNELEIGNRLEPFVAQWCCDLYEPSLKLHGTTVRSKMSNCDWMLCTPDYVSAAGDPWEIKAWLRDPGDYVEAQVRWQMLVLNTPIGHIGWWRRNGFDPPEHRLIARDSEAEELMMKTAQNFWFGYVVPKKEPPTDASDACSRYFSQKKSTAASLSVDENHDIHKTAMAYRLASEQVETAELLKAESGNKLKRMIYELDAVSGPFGEIKYVWHKGKTDTAWETVARRFMGMIVAPDGDGRPMPKVDLIKLCESIVAQHTTGKPGYRQLHPNWSKT